MKTAHPALPVLDPRAAPARYEEYFVPAIGRPFAEALVDFAAPGAGSRVLDAACGTGIVARLAARRVGPQGAVVGVDLDPGMLAEARSASSGVEPAPQWFETGLEAMPLPDESFDLVLCQFGLQFVSDKAAALGEMRRVLAPGGRVFASVPVASPFFDSVHDAMARQVDPAIAGFMASVFSWNAPDAMEPVICGAGFEQASFRTETRVLRLPPPREFLWQYIQSTPLAGALSKVEPHRLVAFEHDVVRDSARWSTDEGMTHRQDVVVACAVRPPARH